MAEKFQFTLHVATQKLTTRAGTVVLGPRAKSLMGAAASPSAPTAPRPRPRHVMIHRQIRPSFTAPQARIFRFSSVVMLKRGNGIDSP